jgi:acetyl esterase/lipase
MTGEVRVEASPVGPVVRPPDPCELVLLYLHGDRYLSGAPESALGLAGRLALRTGVAVVCARYRSAFPAALEDVEAGYRYSQAAGPVVVAGERLGAGLAAALLVRLRDAGAARPRGAILVSGLLDLAAGNDVLLDDSLEFAARAARSGVPVDLRVRPDAASLHAETLPAMAAFIVDAENGTGPVKAAAVPAGPDRTGTR